MAAEHELWSAAVDAVDAAWKAFVSDVFDPLQTEFNKLFGDALSDGSLVIGLVIKVLKWVEALAKISYDDATAWGTSLVDFASIDRAQLVADAVAASPFKA